jgi:type II secretory pathway pseudopilin PulG
MKKIKFGETGIVSLLVTMVLMMIISLTILGFAQMSRREQQQALDRQLGTQAFLAAETGINDAKQAIIKALESAQEIPEKTTCGNPAGSGPYSDLKPVLDAASGVAYSCLLVSTRLQNIVQTIPADGTSSTIPLKPAGLMNRLRIDWATTEPPTESALNNCPASLTANGTNSFPQAALWNCPYGVLRIDMVKTSVFNRAQLMADNRTVFLYPTRAAAPRTVAHASMNGAVAAMACTISRCTINITNIDTTSVNYAMRVTGIYNSGVITVSATNSANTELLLKDAQAKIDSTGRAAGVLRRIETRIPLISSGNVPVAALVSGSSICKRFGVGPAQFQVPSDIVGQDQNNPMCRAFSSSPAVPAPTAPPGG